MIITRNLPASTYNINQLIEEMLLVPKFLFVQKYEDPDMDIEVESDWGGADDTALDLVITNHDNTPVPQFVPDPIRMTFGSDQHTGIKGKEITYKRIVEFYYPGGPHTAINFRYTDKGGIEGSVRLVDVTNADAVVAEKTGMDAAVELIFEDVVMDGSIIFPKGPAIIAIEVKVSVNGSGKESFISAMEIL